MVRMYRQTALSKLEELGYETVQGVLTGKYPTLELAQESVQAKQQ
jgi:phosphoribosylformylglycinamidine (FGAM) synthase PurS component